MVGVVKRSAIMEASSRQVKNSFLKIAGIIGGEELRAMPLLQRSFRRISWLGPNIVLNIIAASVIAFYQDTLQAVIALAVFLPIISDMSGCSGNQAVAVSIRELALGQIKPTEYLRIFLKEGGLGLINGTLLGLLLGMVAFLWKGNLYLGLVVASALALNTVLSVLIGGSVPLALRRMRIDPALASGPILTTVTDMCGFFFVLSFASAVLERL
jgi:magnesium transporter